MKIRFKKKQHSEKGIKPDMIKRMGSLKKYLEHEKMKLVSITMIKNESDIIESFIRYHLNIFDEMIILDNGSADESVKIIENLQNENLPIILIKDHDHYYNQNEKSTKLLKIAFGEYSADIVCPLDADEFLTSDNGNPREILEMLDENRYYKIKWRTYVATVEDNTSVKFIPSRITHIRDDKYESFYKVAVPKKLFLNSKILLELGNHELGFEDIKERNKSLIIDDLRIAHFPLRSVEQCMSKILVGWPNMISKNMENSDIAYHWKILFEKIKEKGSISSEDVELFSKNYSLPEFEKDIEIKENAMNIDFCNDMEIKYSYECNYLKNLLDNYTYYVERVSSAKLDYFDENSAWETITHQKIKPEYINFDKNDHPKVSIVIPIYNTQKYLNECLDSVVNQTFKDIEIICVNDGSTDDTLEILKSYAEKDERVKIISQEKSGAGAARNKGLEASKGQYVYTMDSDDWIYPDAIEDMYGNAVLNNSDIVMIKYGRDEILDRENSRNGFYLDDELHRSGEDYKEFTFTYKDIKRNVLNTYFNHWMCFYKKEFLDEWDDFKFQENSIFEDVIFHVKTFLRAERISHIPRIYYYYRRVESSQMRNYRKYSDIFKTIDAVDEFLKENDFMEEFKNEFDLFTIVQCLTYILCTDSEEYFQITKKYFAKIDLSPDHIVEPHRVNVRRFVLESADYQAFLKNYYSYMLRNANAATYNIKLEKDKVDEEIKSLKKKNSQLKEENSSLKKLNDSLMNSRSWKMTEPLRKIKQLKK